MEKTTLRRGFTIVELIIVIAVIGVLAAILIPTFANVIKRSNAKSALSDARNGITQLILHFKNEDVETPQYAFFLVEKAGKIYSYKYTNSTGGLDINEESGNLTGYSDLAAAMAGYGLNPNDDLNPVIDDFLDNVHAWTNNSDIYPNTAFNYTYTFFTACVPMQTVSSATKVSSVGVDEGGSITAPVVPASINIAGTAYTFQGWALNSVDPANITITAIAPTFTCGNVNASYYAIYENSLIGVSFKTSVLYKNGINAPTIEDWSSASGVAGAMLSSQNGGSSVNATLSFPYTAAGQVINLDYNFVGWYENANGTGSPRSTIPNWQFSATAEDSGKNFYAVYNFSGRIIKTATDFANLSTDLDAIALLVNDITSFGTLASPVGSVATPFTGIFLGMNHKIGDVTVSDSTSHYIGLFGVINGGIVAELEVENSAFYANENVGAIAGSIQGAAKIDNCVITNCTLSSEYSKVGMITGVKYSTATITNCSHTSTITQGTCEDPNALYGYAVS